MAANEVMPPLPDGFQLVEPTRPPLPARPVNRSNQAAQTLGGAAPAQPTSERPRAPQAAAQAGADVPPLPEGFELQDQEQSSPQAQPPVRQVGFAESAGRVAGSAATPVVRTAGLGLAGALEAVKKAAVVADIIAPMFGLKSPGYMQMAQEAQDKVFQATDEITNSMDAMYKPQAGEEFSLPGQIAGGVSSMPLEMLGGLGIARGVERAADVVERGGSLGEAGKAGAVTGAVNLAANALPIKVGGKVGNAIEGAIGKGLGARGGAITGGALTGGALGVAGDAATVTAGNAALPEGEQFQDLKEETDPGVSFGLGAAFGALPGVAAPRRAAGGKAAEPTAGTKPSAGAAGTDAETVRRQRAASLPVPVELTKGQATRDAQQQQFEKQQYQDADTGKALREMTAEQTDRILKNFDALEEQTGATKTGNEEIGESVVGPIEQRVAEAKTKIREAYKAAEDAGETAERVSPAALVSYLNDESSSAINAPIIKSAGDRLVQLGGAERDADGRLVPGEISLSDLEKIRQSISKDAGEPGTPNSFRAGEIKTKIDAVTDGKGGDLYKAARKLYADYASEFKNQALIRDLIANKSGTTDRKIALEQVYDKTVKNGSIENLRRLQDTLVGAGEAGQQALRELRGAAVRDIREQATRTTAVDERGQKVPSVAGLQRAVAALDKNGKLELLFGKQGAQTFRDLGDLASDIYTAPPGLVNTSGTAAAIAKLTADWAASMAITGVPAPLLSIGKAIKQWRSGRKTKAQIAEALKQPEGLINPNAKPDLDARPFDAASVARPKAEPLLRKPGEPLQPRAPETARVIELRKQKSVLESLKKCLEA